MPNRDLFSSNSYYENQGTACPHAEYTCANDKKLRVIGTETRVNKIGYESEVTVYKSEGCEGCPVRERCTASQKNRRMDVSKKLLAFRDESEANIKSGEGILPRVNRSIQVEGTFGVI
jgi:hypothetical protein